MEIIDPQCSNILKSNYQNASFGILLESSLAKFNNLHKFFRDCFLFFVENQLLPDLLTNINHKCVNCLTHFQTWNIQPSYWNSVSHRFCSRSFELILILFSQTLIFIIIANKIRIFKIHLTPTLKPEPQSF